MVFRKIKAGLIAIGAFILVLGAAFLRGLQMGKKQAEAKTNEQILQNAQEAKARQDTYDAMPIDAKRKRVRERWTKR